MRVGEPHLVFVSQSGKELVALLQTGGYSSRGGLPAWRNIEIADIVSVEQTPDQFELRPDFDRASTRYYRPIC